MATDDEVPAADATASRRELEKVAFARPQSDADAAAAAEALRELAELDAASATVAAPPAAERLPDVVAGPAPVPAPRPAPDALADPGADATPGPASESQDEPAKPERRGRRRSLVPLVVLLGVAVGVAGGFAFAHAAPGGLTTDSTTQPPTTGVQTSFGFTPIGPQYASASAATAALKAKQTAADVFPLPSFTKTLDVEPTSIHRILTTDDGLTLWIGRTSEDICLMFSGPDATSSLDAGSNCATPSAFGTDGLTLGDGKDQWSWNGVEFTTTIAH